MKIVFLLKRIVLFSAVSVVSISCSNEQSGEQVSHTVSLSDESKWVEERAAVLSVGKTRVKSLDPASEPGVQLPAGKSLYYLVDSAGKYEGDSLTISGEHFTLNEGGSVVTGRFSVTNGVWKLRSKDRVFRKFVHATHSDGSAIIACWGATPAGAVACGSESEITYLFADEAQAENFQGSVDSSNPTRVDVEVPESLPAATDLELTGVDEWDPNVPLPAFPGAEGFGASTVGGRGGKVYEVSNLNDRGTGSFRACAEALVPRICVFRTGGLITLDSTIEIESPFITIAGQSAPGGGISLRTRSDLPDAAMKIQTHDVVIRYLRIRPGASYVMGDTQDALTIASSNDPVYNIIVDHSSLSWASDEVAQVWYEAFNITFQWNIISEGLHCMNHTDSGCAHSKGLLLGSANSHSISIHHNLFAHHSERNPRIAMTGIADVVNNVIYNPMHSGSQITNKNGRAQVNYVNNFMKKGNDSLSDNMISLKSYSDNDYDLYVRGNIGPLRQHNSIDETLVVKHSDAPWRAVKQHDAPPVTVYPCKSVTDCQSYEKVIANAGAVLPSRDAVDKRIIQEVKTGTGRIIDSQSQADCYLECTNFLQPEDYAVHGISDPMTSDGWPILANGQPYPDQDHDGMADDWEHENGLNSNLNDSGGHQLHGGYTNIEVFLNSL